MGASRLFLPINVQHQNRRTALDIPDEEMWRRLLVIAGRRKSVAFLTLKEAADYARFACAAYAVFEYEDVEEKDEDGHPVLQKGVKICGAMKPTSKLKTYGTVVRYMRWGFSRPGPSMGCWRCCRVAGNSERLQLHLQRLP